ncbi:MAG: efflux RND transporter periplasmic adaptor subunit [Bacteroidia bacterium]|nr:efflux RND transporter periplasmic adaptor subunit [Bacteroidia bacterium]
MLAAGVSAGTSVEPGDFLLRIADLSRVRLQMYLYPEQFTQAEVGMAGEAFLPGWDESIKFRIQQFLPTLNEETRVITAYTDLSNPGRKLLPGSFFQAKLHSLRADSAIAAPLSALILDADRRYALTYRSPCKWEIRPVEVLRQTTDRVYVRGLMPQETVATRQVLFLYYQLTRTL